jgi:hypothetical protein
MIDALARMARGRLAAAIVAAWGFGEAIVVPLVPDLLLLPLVTAAPRRALALFGWTLVGAIAGSLVLSAITLSDPAAGRGIVLGVPGIRPDIIEAAEAAVAGGDPLAMVHLGPGIPLKVYTVAWWAGSVAPLAPYLVGVVANRIVRIGAAIAIFALLGLLAPRWLRRHERLALAGYVVFWLGVAWLAGQIEGAPALL